MKSLLMESKAVLAVVPMLASSHTLMTLLATAITRVALPPDCGTPSALGGSGRSHPRYRSPLYRIISLWQTGQTAAGTQLKPFSVLASYGAWAGSKQTETRPPQIFVNHFMIHKVAKLKTNKSSFKLFGVSLLVLVLMAVSKICFMLFDF